MWSGAWRGNWVGSWDGSTSQPLGYLSAALSGAGTLTGSANAAAYLASGLTGSGDLIGQLESAAFGPADISASLYGSGSFAGTLVDLNASSDLYINYARKRGRR
jgi:hypothetical protein